MDTFVLTVTGTLTVTLSAAISIIGFVFSYLRSQQAINQPTLIDDALELYQRVNADNAQLRSDNKDWQSRYKTLEDEYTLYRKLAQDRGILIQVTQRQGGIDASGSARIETGKDLIGGNKTNE